MREDLANGLALRALERLRPYFDRADIEEICINRPGYVFTKPRGADWFETAVPEASYRYLLQLCTVLAHVNGQTFDLGDLPIVSCNLPGQPFRFQGIIGPNVRYERNDSQGVAISIRSLMASDQYGFDAYGLRPGVDLPGMARMFEGFDVRDDHLEQIARVVANHQTVLVAGATGTGKTTLTNQIIKLIDPRLRLISVEDTQELTIPQPNRVMFLVARNTGVNRVDYTAILDSLVRLTPDWVVCGELSVKNAQAVFTLMGKGHPLISTIHASTPEEAMRAFINNMATAGASGLDPHAVLENLRANVGCIIQIERRDNRRQIVDIAFPAYEHFLTTEADRLEEVAKRDRLLQRRRGRVDTPGSDPEDRDGPEV